jgi:hypothetical protein
MEGAEEPVDTLVERGISKHQPFPWQRLAAIPAEAFEAGADTGWHP